MIDRDAWRFGKREQCDGPDRRAAVEVLGPFEDALGRERRKGNKYLEVPARARELEAAGLVRVLGEF